MTLKDIAIFKLKPLVTNFTAKLSAITAPIDNGSDDVIVDAAEDCSRQVLCLCHENNDLFFRYTATGSGPCASGEVVVVKLLPWFNERGKVVQDICFDTTNKWCLLVLCDDNTLHVVPVQSILQQHQQQSQQAVENGSHIITSYIIPFVGPHECPNPRTCPNNFYQPPTRELEQTLKNISGGPAKATTLDELYSKQRVDQLLATYDVSSTYFCDMQPQQGEDVPTDANGSPTLSSSSGASASTLLNQDNLKQDQHRFVCPYPTAVTWWRTTKNHDRAIVGYSDGSICFLSLTPNCPLIASTAIPEGMVEKLDICVDSSGRTSTLLIQSSKRTQWKLLLEEEHSHYIFPGDYQDEGVGPRPGGSSQKIIEQEWQFVVTPPQVTVTADDLNLFADHEITKTIPKLFPATRAGISYLREVGTKKIGALKQKLADRVGLSSSSESSQDSANESHGGDTGWTTMEDGKMMVACDVLESPSYEPERISSAAGPKIIVKNHNRRSFLYALHKYTDSISVHNLNMDPEPLYVYRLPAQCEDVLVTQNTMYTIQMVPQGSVGRREKRDALATDTQTQEATASTETEQSSDAATPASAATAAINTDLVNACGVVSKTLSMKNKDCDVFEDRALVTYFPFVNERIINMHGLYGPSLASAKVNNRHRSPSPTPTHQSTSTGSRSGNKLNVRDYVRTRNQYECPESAEGGSNNNSGLMDIKILEGVFPHIHFEQCFIVTDRNVFTIELSDRPEAIFMNFAKQSMWSSCKYFCDIFNVSMPLCIEYVGDELLRQRKVTQALMTYNVAQIPPIKTALKLATYGESNALLHLCAMALKCLYVLKSSRPTSVHMRELLADTKLRDVPQKEATTLLASGLKQRAKAITATAAAAADEGDLNSGIHCSDFSYSQDEVASGMDVQMSFSSQFHLSNLLLLTLCERTLTEKNHFPLWNFIQINPRFHTNLASTMLAQSGLYSTAILLAKLRSPLDVFVNLVRSIGQEFGTDINYLLYNLSDTMFRECITYLSGVAVDYFQSIKSTMDRFSIHVLHRIIDQLNPFDATYRPIVSRLSSLRHAHRKRRTDDVDAMFPTFCKAYIEAFLCAMIRCVEMAAGAKSQLINGLYNINIRYESLHVPLTTRGWSQLSAGYAHGARILNGCGFIWGSNQVPYAVNSQSVGGMGPEHTLANTPGPRPTAFLSNLGITVLSIHCGRTHTLIFTNNGLYAMGYNNLGQLGVGMHCNQSPHPVLVHGLNNKEVTMIAVGQYHNAVVANGQLFMWGWGVYGQLGNNSIEDVPVPTEVEFFAKKHILQISLGHVHSMVLCEAQSLANQLIMTPMEARTTELYVFGSNYFGQLGLGQSVDKSFIKSMVPIILDLNENVRLIHTKYFVSFAVTTSNTLFTWGSSPQALRIINQARKRARSQIRNEMMKEEQKAEAAATAGGSDAATTSQTDGQQQVIVEVTRPKAEARRSRRRNSVPVVSSHKVRLSNRKSPSQDRLKELEEEKQQQDCSASLKRRPDGSPDVTGVGTLPDQVTPPKEARELADLEEWTEHLRPSIVDTSTVGQENILQISSGLYHAALRTASRIFTWGKNIEKQLGNDASRADVPLPTALDGIPEPVTMDCGADFTLVMTASGSVLAFGNNNVGQCGRDTSDKSAMMGKWVRLKISKRHIRIPDGSACISAPTEITFPDVDATAFAMGDGMDKVNPLKGLPTFKGKFFTLSSYLGDAGRWREPMDVEQKVSMLALDDGVNSLGRYSECSDATTPEDELRPWSVVVGEGTTAAAAGEESEDVTRVKLDNGLPKPMVTPEFIHYCLYLFHGIYDHEALGQRSTFAEFRIRLKMMDLKFYEAFDLALQELATDDALVMYSELERSRMTITLLEFFTKDENLIPMHEEDLKYFIQATFVMFINRKWPLDALEQYLLANLNMYIMPLAYALFFDEYKTEVGGIPVAAATATAAMKNVGSSEDAELSCNSRQLRDSVLYKYRQFFSHLERDAMRYRVVGADKIFDSVSCTFNAYICQRVIEIFEQINDN